VASQGASAEAARADVIALLEARGHAVDNARRAVERLEQAFAEGALARTEDLDEALSDLGIALRQGEGQRLGGKSADAARRIGQRIGRLIAEA
jgi:hypothetical protein